MSAGQTRWLEVTVGIHPVAHDAVGSFLFGLGSTGLFSEEATPGTFKAYLPFQPDIESLRQQIEEFLNRIEELFPEAGSHHLDIHLIRDDGWSLKWREHFRPERITDQLIVVPPWDPVSRDFHRHTIRIDPGPAFGTGKHPSTRMCLKAMEQISPPPPWTMLDLGTGSGILAMYGALMGAERVVAVDSDPDALRWARHNLDLNELSNRIQLSRTPVAEMTRAYTLVVANLSLPEIGQLSEDLVRLVNSRSWLILSGFLEGQLQQIRRLMKGAVQETGTLLEDEWACLIFQRKG